MLNPEGYVFGDLEIADLPDIGHRSWSDKMLMEL
jgi:hypothetical protein